MWLTDLTLQTIGFRVLTLLIIVGIQGGILAATAVLLGDKGPRYDGRLTIMPFSHIDFAGAISLIIFGLGWAKQMDIDSQQFRVSGVSIITTIFAGFIGLLIVATLLNELVLPALTMLPFTVGIATAEFLRGASSLTVWFALLSLIPIPPLTGGLLISIIGLRVPQKTQWILAIILLVGVATGVIHQLLYPAYSVLASLIFIT
jgi:hypothetical protein|tara:strand:- start:100 stop:708 length:609 start_codon:yes stop_codon:yes gene_type:complete